MVSALRGSEGAEPPGGSVAWRRCKAELRGIACATKRSDTPQLAAGKFILRGFSTIHHSVIGRIIIP